MSQLFASGGGTINAIQTDTGGNIYLAGFQGPAMPSPAQKAFIAKLGPDGSLIYSVTLGGSEGAVASALAVDAAGAAYVAGATQSPDFPVTAGALQTTLESSASQGFVAKLDPQGRAVYTTFIGGSAMLNTGAGEVAVDAAGDVIVSGQAVGAGFPAAAGAPFNSPDNNTSFVLELDPAGGKLLGAIHGIGGRIALDGQGNIYIAGAQNGGGTPVPVTPGAYQSNYHCNLAAATHSLHSGAVTSM